MFESIAHLFRLRLSAIFFFFSSLSLLLLLSLKYDWWRHYALGPKRRLAVVLPLFFFLGCLLTVSMLLLTPRPYKVYTSSLATTLRAEEELMCGNVLINGIIYSIELPHGGVKESGYGKDISHLSLRDYYEIRRVSIKRSGM